MNVHLRTEEFKPNRTALPRRLVGRRPVIDMQVVANDYDGEEFVDFDYVDIDGIKGFNTPAAIAEHMKNVATPHRFEVGDLIDLHFTRRGHFEAIVLERHLLSPGPNGGRAVTLLFVDDGPLTITVSEGNKKLLQRGYWTAEEVALYLAARARRRANL
ncbi:hypothetical protein ILFOPFJJ_01521 [Ensifer psoraleae]|uniref:hypothetical protein n=1 Tax=Sinorhizobium psoraleae TaxID=520838 RepID=UPI0015681349|nr:hypothetical protein [Sinorhizobium psoraleae]NRP70640.1 hypothetical protein [Sinorhizobium psoraleae]